MKINLPVTDKEYVLKESDSIVTKTDHKGIVTYANEDFIQISGFARDELIGFNHNVVRHPDMPPEAFADLWKSMKAGRPWTGIVKNRCKNGDFYWVLANVTPYMENGKLVGCMSVRSKPSSAQVRAAAAAYRMFREGRAGNLIIKDGSVVHAFWSKFNLARFWKLTIKLRLTVVIAVMLGMLIAIGGMGLIGMSKSNAELLSMYKNSVVPANKLSSIQSLLLTNRLRISGSLVNPSPEAIQRDTAQVELDTEKISKLWDEYRSNEYLSVEDAKLLDKFAESEKLFVAEGLEPAIEALRANNIALANKLVLEKVNTLYLPVGESLRDLMQMQTDDAQRSYTRSVEHFESIRNTAIALILAGVVLATWLGIALIFAITRPLQQALRLVGAVAQGDLTQHIEVKSKDEIGMLLQVLKDMNENLASVIGDVLNSTEAITTAAGEITVGNADLSSRTEEQASSLEETASSMEELTSTVRQNAENARQANQLAGNASAVAIKGGQVVGDVVNTMASISTSSKKIVDIISVIESIAFQTNILALNAAVEAARAGEQGRGFAVVAGEVRSLAQRSAAAAKEIKSLIDDSVGKVDAGSKQVDQAGATMTEIVQAVKRVTDIMSEIAEASGEQSAGIEQVNQAIVQMDEVTQQNAALVEEAAAAAESMLGQANVLMHAVSIFRLDDGSSMYQGVAKPASRSPTKRAAENSTPRHLNSRLATATDRSTHKLANKANEENDGEWKEF